MSLWPLLELRIAENNVLPAESSAISPKEALMARTIIALFLCVGSAKQELRNTEKKKITDNHEERTSICLFVQVPKKKHYL